jgi:hypothetical protein
MGGKRWAQPLPTLLLVGKNAAKSKNPCTWSKSVRRIHFRPMYAGANIDWIRKKASAILERVLRFGTERLRDQEKPYEDYRM